MTAYSSTCGMCGQLCDWVDSSDGYGHGQWVHRKLPYDHSPEVHWAPMERINDHGDWEAV